MTILGELGVHLQSITFDRLPPEIVPMAENRVLDVLASAVLIGRTSAVGRRAWTHQLRKA